MLELQIYKDSEYVSMDIYESEGVDLNCPLAFSSDIDKMTVDYTDTFSVPSTQRNIDILDGANGKKYEGQIKNGSHTIKGHFLISKQTTYTPKESIDFNFVSFIKSAFEELADTNFSELFRLNTETGADLFECATGRYINDGNYGFDIDETQLPYSDNFMAVTTNNFSSNSFEGDSFPIYALDSKTGFRSLHPTYKVGELLKAIFNHFGVTIDVSNEIIEGRDYNDVYMRIPTQLMSGMNMGSYNSRNVIYAFGEDGWLSPQVPPPMSGDYPGVQTENKDMDSFVIAQDLLSENGERYNYHTPQETTDYTLTGAGTRNDFFGKLTYLYGLDDGGYISEEEVDIPDSEVSYTGQLRPAVAIYLYDEIVFVIDIDDDVLYDQHDVALAALEGELSLTYGDAVRAKLGFNCHNLKLTLPTDYNMSTHVWSGTQTMDLLDNFIHYGDFKLRNSVIDVSNPPGGMTVVNGDTVIRVSYAAEIYGTLILEPTEDYGIARYGDKVLLEKSYKDKELTMADVVKNITERFNLTVRETSAGEIEFVKEADYFNSTVIIADTKVSESIENSKEYSEIKSLSITNEDYGNINDYINVVKDKDKRLIYDLDKHIVDNGKTEEKEIGLDSTLQNTKVYGERIPADQMDLEFMGLDRNSALWNTSPNEKIEPESFPISFGYLQDSGVKNFRLPRSVRGNEENYPRAVPEAVTANEEIMVVEHTLFEVSSSFELIYDSDSLNLTNKEGELNTSQPMYLNFKEYIKKIGSDSVILEAEIFLTTSEIMSLREGSKIQLFGVIYNPIAISDIEFEKDGNICRVTMMRNIVDEVGNILAESGDNIITEDDDNIII